MDHALKSGYLVCKLEEVVDYDGFYGTKKNQYSCGSYRLSDHGTYG
mgnify:FL=1